MEQLLQVEMEKEIISINSIILLISLLIKIIQFMYRIVSNHRVMKWMKGAKEGIVVAGGQGQGNSLTQLSYPQGVIVDHLGNVYVADSWKSSNNALVKRIKRR